MPIEAAIEMPIEAVIEMPIEAAIEMLIEVAMEGLLIQFELIRGSNRRSALGIHTLVQNYCPFLLEETI